jgi:hypothetical protein
VTLATKANPPIPKGLPPALRPWSQAFQDMPETHLRLIGDLMGQLNPLLQETFEIDAQSYGEFNGYDGMAMRGEIERLLPSEWLWKELAPNEFLRRFAEQELLYHRPSFESPTDERTHLVAIDCGPDMLGRPRLVALAALLCLNAIARAQGAKLIWTAPQANVAGWQAMLKQQDLKAFLLSANPLSLRSTELEELVQSLPPGQAGAELVLWTVGAVPFTPGAETIKTNQIVISEKMAMSPDGQPVPEARVRLLSHFGRQKEAVFAFPGEEDCVSLLREPFRPLRVHATGIPDKPRAEGEANPLWAPQEIALLEDAGWAVIRVPQGLLGLRLTAGRHLYDPYFVPLERFDNLLGVRWGPRHVFLALTRKYNTFSNLKIKRLPMFQGDPPDEIPDIRLDQDNPVVINKHPRNAVPPLIKPGRKFRLLALTAKGEQYVLDRGKAEQHPQLPRMPLIGYRKGWALMLSGPQEKRLLIARNLATSQCITFALPPNATVETLSDVIYWPEDLQAPGDGCLLLARCDDGHWRGRMGRPNLVQHEHFPAHVVDIDLSSLGHAMPIGPYPGHRGDTTFPPYRACFWSPAERAFVYCGLTSAGLVATEPLWGSSGSTVAPYGTGGAHWSAHRVAMYKAGMIGWDVDDGGYATRIRTIPEVDRPDGQQDHDVAELVGKAKCLSD